VQSRRHGRAEPAARHGRAVTPNYDAVVSEPFRNKRANRAYALTMTHAFFEIHPACPCQVPKPYQWCQVSGKGEEGAWSVAWMSWLWRTHLEPRGWTSFDSPSPRVIDVVIDGSRNVERLLSDITSGPIAADDAPQPPWDITRSRAAQQNYGT
jgi:hypothetical protein